MGINRQSAHQMVSERFEGEAVVDDKCRHAGTTVCTGYGYAIGDGIDDACAVADRVIDLAGCDILALPTKGIANPVDEMEVALGVEPHQIARAEPSIAV